MLEKAKWISYPKKLGFEVPVFQKEFSLEGTVKKAVLEITAQGVYEAHINGKRVGNFFMAPGYTSFERIQVQQYDVTDLLKRENTIRIQTAKGWRYGRIMEYFREAGKKEKPLDAEDYDFVTEGQCSAIARLEILLANGKRQLLVTDQTWQSALTAVRFSEIYDGVIVDANVKEEFLPVKIAKLTRGKLVKQEGEIVTEQERIAPLSIFKAPNGETVCDFGQNLTGVPEIRVNAKKGDKVSLSFGEVLDKENNFYNLNYRTAKAQYEYVCKDGENIFHPTLTFYGFRYARINAFPCEPKKENLTAIVVSSELNRTGYLTSSHPLLNQLFSNIIWGQRGNFLDVPTDCPQRDERMGWTGDAQVFCKTAMYNFDCEKFYEKWTTDIKLDQRPWGTIPDTVPQTFCSQDNCCGWSDVCTVLPLNMYWQYNNVKVLKKMYPVMVKYLNFIKGASTKEYLWTGKWHYGDWLALDAVEGNWSGSSSTDFLASVYYLYSIGIVIEIGKIIGKDVSYYEDLQKKVRHAIMETFTEYKTQTEHVFALYFHVCKDQKAVADSLVKMLHENGDCLKTGFLGTPYLLYALAENGYEDLAYTLLLQEKFPSWLYSVKCGATTIWEHWDGKNDKGEFWSVDMNSFNHYAYGAVADWVYTYALGIRPQKPGFEEVLIAPHATDKIDSLQGEYHSRVGKIISRWFHEDGKIRYEITTPTKTTAIVEGKTYHLEKGTYLF